MQRDFLQDSDNAAKRYAVFMAMFVLISVTVGFNLLYDPEKHKDDKPPSAMDRYRELSAKQRLENIELQRNIAEARGRAKAKTITDI